MEIENWKEVQLQDVAKELTVGYVGTMTSEYVDSGIPFLRSKNVEPFGIKWDDMRYIGRDFHEKLNKSSLSPGDVVIVRTGKPGAAAVIPENLLEANCSDLVIIRPGSTLDARFIVYYLNSLGSHHINSHLVGAVQQHFNVGSARTLRLKLPPLSEQKAIAHILSSLDDKIELNRQMNETLEAMARAIFKSWFVDFDPVRAKMEGRQPAGMDAATADLFPDEFEESSFGLIPKGWLYKPAETICNIGIGKTPPRKESEWFSTSPDDIRWVSIRDMGESGTFISDTKEYLVSEAITRFNVRVVPDHTVILSFKLTIGRVAITDGEMATNEAIAHFKLDNQIDISSEYLYLYLKTFDYNQLGSTSSIAEAINSKIIKAMPILIPNCKLMNKFTNKVVNIFAKINNNQRESYTLANIRDTLLPKLMSGEIRVKEAEKIINDKL
jgi:type I restriction enzyme S subunit